MASDCRPPDSEAGAPHPCRLLIDPPADGAWNMAVDELLLETAAAEGRMSLRFYQWRAPTLSLGYFQRYEDRSQHPASLACACVRRSTGGGAILHDRELTYSIALPPSHPLARSAQDLYIAVHGSLVTVLRNLGFPHVNMVCQPAAESSLQPFLCFQRRCAGDIVFGSAKVVGSAQRRSGGAVLQHGSILLHASPCASELPGLNDFNHSSMTPDRLITSWLDQLCSTISAQFSAGPLTASERSRAAEKARSRYESTAWLRRRRP